MIITMAQSTAIASSESNNVSIAVGIDDRVALTGICVGMDTSVASTSGSSPRALVQESAAVNPKFAREPALPEHAEPAGSACNAWDLCALPFMLPDAHLASLGHQEHAEDQTDRRNRDRVDQRVGKTARRLIRGCRDERHQTAAPAVADHVRHGYRGVA